MSSKLKNMFKSLLSIAPEERLKFIFLSIAFFFIIFAYTLTKELKDAVFLSIVGKEYLPKAKILTLFALIPAIFIYSKLVDSMRRYQLLCLLSFLYSVGGLIFAFLLGHPVYGMSNTDTSPYRILGWLFYFFVEGQSPFLVSLFWAFANSITSPEAAKNNYGIMVSSSKVGGMLSCVLAIWLLSMQTSDGKMFLTDTLNHQILLAVSSLMLLFVPLVIYLLMKKVPGRYLHGYEAVYQLEKQRSKEGEAATGVFAGIQMFIKYPYIFGIFSMVFFYEVINTVLSYARVSIAQENSTSTSEVSLFLFQIMLATHFVGLLVSLFGTRALLSKLGERRSLVLIPLLSGALLFYFIAVYTSSALLIAFVCLRAIHYGFSYPARESLYIPTVKEIKFKAKSWIDAFGSKFAKTTGATFNDLVLLLNPSMFVPAHAAFFAGIIGCWFVAAVLLGRRYEKVIANNEVIGADPV